MKRVSAFACVVFLLATATLLAGDAASAAARFAAGNDLLKKGDLDAALKAWADAARADGENQEYRKQYALLRRVLMIRKGLEHESNPAKIQSDAQAVRSFLYSKALYEQAATLDEKCHGRLHSPESATLLAESLLEVGRNEDAQKLLSGMDAKALTDQGKTLLGLALARIGQLDAAKQASANVALTDAGPALLLHAARLQAVLGNAASACALLSNSLKATRPSQIEEVKARVTACKDFASMANDAEFKTALATASQVPESKCSSGKDCGSCSSKTKCSVSSASKPAGAGCAQSKD